MKRNTYFLAVLSFCAWTVLASCAKEDNPSDPVNPEETTKSMTVNATAYNKWVYVDMAEGTEVSYEIDPVAGTYNGDLSLTVMGQEQGMVEDLKLEVARESTDSVNMVLKDFAFGQYGMIGDVKLGAKVVVDSIGNQLGYVLTGGEVETVLEKYNVKATTSGTVIGKQVELAIVLRIGAMPMAINAVYKGSLEKGTVDETSFSWDIAIHRYDVKTNGGASIETSATELAQLTSLPTTGYTADEEITTIMVDNSNMMNNKIGYATGNVNKELCKWMTLDTSNMPPAYTMSGKVYVLKTAAGKYAKIKFTDYTNDSNVKGHISFDYVYPAQ